MNRDKTACTAAELRQKAEAAVASQLGADETCSEVIDAQRLLHELQVHRVELEMQNEELRRIIAEKSEHEAHLRDIITQTPAGYFHIDEEGRFLEVNDAWLRMHGYDSPDEVIGKHYSMVQVDSGSGSSRAHMNELLKGVPIPAGEFATLRKDGSIGYHTFSVHPPVNIGKISGFEWIIVDISRRKRLEEEKAAIERQFLQAQKLESLGVLAGGIAHDFNNILTIILGCCSMVKQHPEKTEHHITMMESAAMRAAGLCNQMLAYAGKGQAVQSQVNLAEIAEDMVSMLRLTISRNVVIKTSIAAGIPLIKADDSQLRQIVLNLIINAAEAIGEVQGEIRLSLNKEQVKANQEKDYLGKAMPAGLYACLEVADSGCGMDDATMERIFEPFYTTKFTGRGLGMSAVLGIVTSHGGQLQLHSQPGHGTVFKVYLPIRTGDSAAAEPLQQAAMTTWRGSGTVLLVEDEEMILSIAKEMLTKLGFSVIEAANGKEALELYQKNPAKIDLIVTDLGMPVMDGYELFRELKKLQPKLPIIISSGFGYSEVTSKIARDEMAGFISKPYTFHSLQELLMGVEDARRGQM